MSCLINSSISLNKAEVVFRALTALLLICAVLARPRTGTLATVLSASLLVIPRFPDPVVIVLANDVRAGCGIVWGVGLGKERFGLLFMYDWLDAERCR